MNIENKGEELIKNEFEFQEIIDECLGSDLVGAEYTPAYDEFNEEYNNGAFRLIAFLLN